MAGLTLGTVKLGMTLSPSLDVGKPLAVGAYPQVRGAEAGMTPRTELRLVTPRAGLGVVQRPNRVDLPKIRPVAAGLVVAPVRGKVEIGADPPAKMAVLAKGLIMTVNAVVGIFLGRYPMLGIPKTEMIGCHPLAPVALIALLDR
ncbi:MAG: hypothetical protein GTO13_09895 [Proteobacteria bacterium]|nr:hypothetical protein [Pseudomonadota bacterium]